MRSWYRAALVAAALVFTPAVAAADLQAAIDLDAIFPQDDAFEDETGFGISGRVGYLLPLPALDLVPELQVGYVNYGSPAGLEDVDVTLVRVTGGLRAGIGSVIRPSAFAHVGYGRTNLSDDETDFFRSRGGVGEENALTYDVGLALDLTILPLVDVGVHGAWNALETDETLQWFSAGVHASIAF